MKAEPENHRQTLLVVDDETANLQKLRRTFLGEYRVHEATGGMEALEILKDHPVNAIITDQRMHGMSGVELLKRTLKVQPDAVRIILTGYTDVEDLMDAINEGHVHRYITKPWDPFTLQQSCQAGNSASRAEAGKHPPGQPAQEGEPAVAEGEP